MILTEGFRGARPIVDDGLLEDNEATLAQDVKIQGGKLTSMKTDTSVRAKLVTGTLKSLYKYTTGDFFEWNKDVDVVTTQIGNDSYDRRIFTGDTNPKVTYNSIATSGPGPYPAASYLLGTPPPGYIVTTYPNGVACTCAVAGTATDPSDVPETRYYVATSVDIFGAEGPPNLVSNSVEWRPGQTVNVTMPAIPSGSYNITGWRLYRTSTGTSGTDFQYVKAGTSWGAVTNDAVATESLGEVLSTENYDLPHASMYGITAMPGSFLAGHYKNILFFSEPGYPHAWPVGYQLNTKTDIVGIKVVGQNMLLVTTTEKPYICVGTDPNSMSLSELDDVLQACASKRSMADIGPGVVYASPDGLMLISTGGSRLLTEGIFTRDQWQAMLPSSMACYHWEGLCLVFYNTGVVSGGFIINPMQPEAGIVTLTDHIDGAWYEAVSDKLYVSIGGYIKEWATGSTYRTGYWTSKELEFIHPQRFSCGKIWGNDTGTLRLTLADDEGTAVDTRLVSGEKPFRVVGGRTHRGLTLGLTLTGGKDVHRLALAETMRELRGG